MWFWFVTLEVARDIKIFELRNSFFLFCVESKVLFLACLYCERQVCTRIFSHNITPLPDN